MKIGKFETHPAADLFPVMDADALDELVADIRENGQAQPIVVFDGLILDGRNRAIACDRLGVAPKTTEWHGESPTTWVLSVNFHRRHLTASQRAAIATDALPMIEAEAKKRQIASRQREMAGVRAEADSAAKKPMNSRSGNNSGTKKKEYAENESRAKAAKAASVNPRYVSDAKAIKEAAPDLIEKVKVGDLSIPEAKKELAARALPKDTGDLILDADDLPVPDHLRDHWRMLNATVNAILLPLRKVQAEIHAGMDRLMKLEAEAVAAGKAPHSSKAIRDALKVGTIQRGTAIAPDLRMESERVRMLISDVLDLAPAVWCKPCQGAGSVDAVVCANCKGRGFFDKRGAAIKKLTTPRTA